MDAYKALAASYDRLTEDVDYGAVVDFYRLLWEREGISPRTAVDLACGTGSVTVLLAEMGFACEDFGGDTVLVREVPVDMDAEDTTATLEELASILRTGRDPAERREHMFHTMACKAAIKAGMVSDPAELRVLADRQLLLQED